MPRSPILDPTAGERARQIHELPAVPRPILDPTDPRNGLPARDGGGASGPRSERRESDPHVVDSAA